MKTRLAWIAALFVFAACSNVLQSVGDILGSTGSTQQSDVRGVVTIVDTGNRRIDLDVSYVNNLRDQRNGSSIYYDERTVVEYRGQQFRPEDLERGDEISATGANDSGTWVADRITVTRNIRG